MTDHNHHSSSSDDLDAAWARISETDEAERGRALIELGMHLFDNGDINEALAAADAARELFLGAGELEDVALCDHNAAVCLTAMNRCDEAEQRHRDAIANYEQAGRDYDAASCRIHLAGMQRDHGETRRAITLLSKATRDLREDGPSAALGDGLLQLAELHFQASDISKAHRAATAAIPVLEATAPIPVVARGRKLFAEISVVLERYAVAEREYKAARAIFDALDLDAEAFTCEVAAAVVAERGDEAALDVLDRLRATAKAMGSTEMVAAVDVGRAFWFLAVIDDGESAAALLADAAAVFRACAAFAAAARAEALRGEALAACGHRQDAIKVLRWAASELHHHRRLLDEARARVALARLEVDDGDELGAAHQLRAAERLLRRGGRPSVMEAYDELFQRVAPPATAA